MNGLRGVKIICLGPREGFATLRRLIENHGADVRAAVTLPEFREIRRVFPPELVFVWLVRDTCDLIKVIPLLQRQHWRIPVIVVTDHMNVDLYLDALTLGAFDAVNLPIDERELLRIARCALAESPSHTLPAVA